MGKLFLNIVGWLIRKFGLLLLLIVALLLTPSVLELWRVIGEFDSDKRNSQYLYITQEHYIKNGIKADDLQKVALLAFKFKLEKRPLAVKLIDQIYKL